MNFIVDIGNTRVKVALFERDQMKEVFNFALQDPGSVVNLLKDKNPSKAIVSSVVNEAQEMIHAIKKQVPLVIEFAPSIKIPVKNLYKTVNTLGNDRIPPIVAAHQQFPSTDLLVIDAGTCIKYNFLNRNGEYLGGAISPGLNMRFKALHTFTARLPLVEPEMNFDKLIGTDSRESILAGVQTAAVAEVNEMIKQYKQQYPNVKVFLTGGDVPFFEKRIKNRIFADANLVLKGLNIILNYNA